MFVCAAGIPGLSILHLSKNLNHNPIFCSLQHNFSVMLFFVEYLSVHLNKVNKCKCAHIYA